MRRSSEAPVIVALVALMLTATLGLFNSLRTGDEFAHLATLGRSVQQWLSSHRVGNVLRQHFSVVGGPAAAPASTSSVQTQPEEMEGMSGIAQRLMHSLRPEDWKRLGEALTTPDEHKAAQIFSQVLSSRLTPQDAAWLRRHFHGRTAFDAEDVRLLRAAFSEMKQELTPDEQRMLLAQLRSWLSN
ncbi:hypothetical protein [Alicyclobacillus shizuokensis]|uniref:hypothetical protein n=1 Tax=Alicyclobacillus shizuokensis TaxID=392014 RepID=UPI000833773D|nr:hypothetical protein [Alicyclobacillus shizuokensis]